MKGALIIIGAALLAMCSIFLIFAFFRSAPPPEGRITVPEATTGTSTRAPATRGPDIGRGEPNDFCATSRLGESFVFNGVTYTCSGPKPYRWRAE